MPIIDALPGTKYIFSCGCESTKFFYEYRGKPRRCPNHNDCLISKKFRQCIRCEAWVETDIRNSNKHFKCDKCTKSYYRLVAMGKKVPNKKHAESRKHAERNVPEDWDEKLDNVEDSNVEDSNVEDSDPLGNFLKDFNERRKIELPNISDRLKEVINKCGSKNNL